MTNRPPLFVTQTARVDTRPTRRLFGNLTRRWRRTYT